MSKVKVIFKTDITTPKKKYKAGTKYNINEDLFNSIYWFCDVIKMKVDNDDYEMAYEKLTMGWNEFLRPKKVDFDAE